MLFDSVAFLFFLPSVLLLHWVLRGKARAAAMVLASYVFYGSWDWRFLGLLMLSTSVDFAIGRRMQHCFDSDRGADDARRDSRRWLLISLAFNLGILGFFKYFGFFVQSFAAFADVLGWELSIPVLEVVLPVGISFYTFQSMGYTIDVYRQRMRAEPSLLSFALYVAWFPQLVAGPIERASRMLPRLTAERSWSSERTANGLMLVLWGLFKKMVIADTAALIANAGYGTGELASQSAAETYFATLAFALQIYADFSGYTDIARGVSRMFGVDLALNFKHPYLATGPADFWRRWHISLSEWLRDYLYIPLGGDRTGHVYRNLMLTMLLGGLWHGAAWNYVLWGGYHGAILCLERWWKARKAASTSISAQRRALQVFLMFQLTLVGWALFRAKSLEQIVSLMESLFVLDWTPRAGAWAVSCLVLALPIAAIHVVQLKRGHFEPSPSSGNWTRCAFASLLLCAILVFYRRQGTDFIYFQF